MRLKRELEQLDDVGLVVDDENAGIGHGGNCKAFGPASQRDGSVNTMRNTLPPPARGSCSRVAPLACASSRARKSPSPVPCALRVKNGSKMRSDVFGRDAGAAVGDLDERAPVGREPAVEELDRRWPVGGAAVPDGVLRKVPEDLLQVGRVGPNLRDGLGHCAGHDAVRAAAAASRRIPTGTRSRNAGSATRSGLLRPASRELQHVLDDAAHALDRCCG